MATNNKKIINLVPLEDNESKDFAQVLDQLVAYKKIYCFSHIPNETSIKHIGYLSKMKAMGKRRGVPDFVIACHKKILFVEMKRRIGKNGKSVSVVSDEQIFWIDNLNKINNQVVVARICYGSDEAIKFVLENI